MPSIGSCWERFKNWSLWRWLYDDLRFRAAWHTVNVSWLGRLWRWTYDTCLMRSVRWGVYWFWSGGADLRSAAVGAFISWIFVSFTTALAASQNIEYSSFAGDNSPARPLPTLLRLLAADEEKTVVTFEPAGLKELQVCEFAHVSAPSGRELLFSYVDRYAMCLDVVRRDPQVFVIKPNRRAGSQLTETAAGFFCKCQN